jgi:hypothetical protein
VAGRRGCESIGAKQQKGTIGWRPDCPTASMWVGTGHHRVLPDHGTRKILAGCGGARRTASLVAPKRLVGMWPCPARTMATQGQYMAGSSCHHTWHDEMNEGGSDRGFAMEIEGYITR